MEWIPVYEPYLVGNISDYVNECLTTGWISSRGDAGAIVIDGIRICNDVVIGAGATVVDHIIAPGTYVGTPARSIG